MLPLGPNDARPSYSVSTDGTLVEVCDTHTNRETSSAPVERMPSFSSARELLYLQTKSTELVTDRTKSTSIANFAFKLLVLSIGVRTYPSFLSLLKARFVVKY